MKRVSVLVAITLLIIGAVVGVVAVVSNDQSPRSEMMHHGSGGTPSWWESLMGGSGMEPPESMSEPEYLAELVAHHREAVASARQLTRSDRPQMRAFSESIVETQSAQIEQMLNWLAQWYPEHPTQVPYRPMMRDLSGLTGDQLDQTFLEDMVGHHKTAVMMSQHLLVRGVEHAQVADLAEKIRDDQHTEIVQMQRWLTRWFDVTWHAAGMHAR